MSVIPPLDRLTKAPALGVDKIQQQFNNILDSIVDQANKTIKDSAKLPTNVNSDDPRVKNIKQSLENIQLSITKVQENIPKIQSAITAMSTIISTLIPVLTTAIAKLNTVSDDDIELNIPTNISTGLNTDTNYNDLIPTEFYNESNVSEDDLTQRSNSIEQLVDQQRNLLTSLQEAPSQVYRGNGNPLPNLGKIGDYYLNTSNNVSYGPKISDNDWGTPIN